ncbi:hypothetical protein, partial [Paraburkholderia bonniea]
MKKPAELHWSRETATDFFGEVIRELIYPVQGRAKTMNRLNPSAAQCWAECAKTDDGEGLREPGEVSCEWEDRFTRKGERVSVDEHHPGRYALAQSSHLNPT